MTKPEPKRQTTKPKKAAVIYIVGPDGDVITRGSLPAASRQHWRIRLKAKVVAAVEGGLITREEACARYHMSEEEYAQWRRMVERSGLTDWVVKYAKPAQPSKVSKPEGKNP